MRNDGTELVFEFQKLLNKMQNHCSSMKKITREDGLSECVDCKLSRYYSYFNSGCLFQELLENDLDTVVRDTIDYHNLR